MKTEMAGVKRKAGRPVGTGLNGVMRVLTPEEVVRLKKAADEYSPKYGLAIRLILELALRVCELTRMRLEDFNGLSRPCQVTVRGAKGGFTKAYDLHPRLWARYLKWLKVREPKDSPWLFPHRLYGQNEHSGAMGFQGTFKVLCRKAGIAGRHSIHDLRHTSATRIAQDGGTAFAIASRLRHRDLNSAKAYIDFTDTKAFDKERLERYED